VAFDNKNALAFVHGIDLSRTPRPIVTMDAATDAREAFDTAKSQARIVGSGVFSFAQGVDADVRESIADSALLAQLVANKSASAEQTPLEWFAEYSKVLQNIGWTLQEGAWTDYTAQGTAVEVHEKIVEVMKGALGPSATALAIITSTIGALKAMSPDSPWITIFSRESQKARMARFQIGLVEKDLNADVFVSMLACLIEAQNTVTQVLVFKFKESQASFKANSARVSINRNAAAQLRPAIRSKIRAYQEGYVSGILNL
jgi:hypothetical protein